MGRRTRRENRQAARQAGLYKEQALPIITNEMLEDAFTKKHNSSQIAHGFRRPAER